MIEWMIVDRDCLRKVLTRYMISHLPRPHGIVQRFSAPKGLSPDALQSSGLGSFLLRMRSLLGGLQGC
jgi:hypothetical protein